jgi:hypothetical protein
LHHDRGCQGLDLFSGIFKVARNPVLQSAT